MKSARVCAILGPRHIASTMLGAANAKRETVDLMHGTESSNPPIATRPPPSIGFVAPSVSLSVWLYPEATEESRTPS